MLATILRVSHIQAYACERECMVQLLMYEYVESDPLLRPKATIHIFKKALVTVSL